ncbi:hypothetical protein K523DRAFT_69392 [Schizophyllum commune Tattone D]|nr:hypothetical protein K523DRAFT_69392 [Schizophyllum commune Tattone D]
MTAKRRRRRIASCKSIPGAVIPVSLPCRCCRRPHERRLTKPDAGNSPCRARARRCWLDRDGKGGLRTICRTNSCQKRSGRLSCDDWHAHSR